MDDQNLTNDQSFTKEEELIERAKNDDQAFEVLYNRYFPKIYGYLFKRTGNKEITEDLTSMTFMKVFCNLEKYESRGYAFSAWIYRIATNNLVDHYRKSGKKQEVDIDQASNVISSDGSPEDFVDQQKHKKEIETTLEKMPERYKKVLYLKYFAEMSNTEVAQVLEISPNNAGVLIYRALKNFENIHQKYGK